MSEWWDANAKPIVDAISSWDIQQIKGAFLNVPSAYVEYIRKLFERSPEHVIIETFLIVFILYIAFVKKSYDPQARRSEKLTEDEIDELCEDWQPEPLLPLSPSSDSFKKVPRAIVENIPDTHIKIQGVSTPLLNFATFDFLGLGSRSEIKNVVVKALEKYGCGSCGPRGFYGTIDTHKILEKDIAGFLQTDDSIVYSDSDSTTTSVLPAFAKRGDLLVIDRGCNDSIHVGAYLSRSRLIYYKHNDMKDLEKALMDIQKADREAGRGSDCQRRYIVTEALFRNSGHIVNLLDLLKLCEKFFFRLILDESFSIGVLGKTGRGLTEYYNVDINNVDIICGSMSNTFASVGGFGTGSQLIVDYQRINSAGYVFSASAPPFTSAASSEALKILQEEPNLLDSLQENTRYFYSLLDKDDSYSAISNRDSPIIHLVFSKKIERSLAIEGIVEGDKDDARNITSEFMEKIYVECIHSGVALTVSQYKSGQIFEPMPTIRLVVRSTHEKSHLEDAANALSRASEKVFHLKTRHAKEEIESEDDIQRHDPNYSKTRRSARLRKPNK